LAAILNDDDWPYDWSELGRRVLAAARQLARGTKPSGRCSG